MKMKQIGRASRLLGLASLVVLSACFDDERVDTLSPSSNAQASFKITTSDLSAAVGQRITVAIEATSSEVLAGVQGLLRFDPARLGFAGQIPEPGTAVIINESQMERGEIRLAAMSPTALNQRIAYFAFEVVSPSYTRGLSFQPDVVADVKTEELRARNIARDVSLDAQLPSSEKPVRWNYLDWAVFLDPSVAQEVADIRANIAGLPASGTLYGDSNLSGGINVSDFTDVGNTAVGNREVIIGTTTVDRVTAGNVRPLAAGACLAGFTGTDCASRVINVTDAIAIGQEAVGTNVPVVGDPIPLPKSAFVSGDTVFLAAQTITGATPRRFDRDTLYILQGVLRVGEEASPNCNEGSILVEPGTVIEGETNSAIFITRCGRINADGTPTQPITFTCRAVTLPRIAGCWGGVFIAGNAIVNEQDASLPLIGPAPQLNPRNPSGGQNQRRGEGGAVNYGGGQDADSSGVIRYARFMYGGDDLGNNNELNNLTVGACGSRTVLSHIQVHAGEDDGLEFFAGRCSVKYLYATANDDDGFDYSFGYDGNVQFLVVQHCRVAMNDCDKNWEVDNTETANGYNAMPRTNPQIFNVTNVGGDQGNGTQHIHYRRGAGGTIRNMLIVTGPTADGVAFIVDDAETCTANSGLSFSTTLVQNVTTLLQGGAGCTPPAIQNGVNVDAAPTGSLKDAFNTILPDFRPTGNGYTSTVFATATTPPGGGFFDTSATFFGGVAPIGLNPGSVPWYAGWTMPWQSATVR
jgi:hypothetical protein